MLEPKTSCKKGQRIFQKGDIIADGPSTEYGELALGKNVLSRFYGMGI